jgi:UPF0755 protein
MKKVGRFLLFVLVLVAGAVAWSAWKMRQPHHGFTSSSVVVDIPRGTSRHRIAMMLEQSGVIEDWLLFEAYSRVHNHAALQAGEYEFSGAESLRDAYWKIAQGHVLVHTVVVPEGWTMFDIAGELERQGLCSREEFLSFTRDAARAQKLLSDIAPQARSLEGFLFPATYDLVRHMSAQAIGGEMVLRFREAWAHLEAEQRDVPAYAMGKGGTVDAEKVVTMASLVEREASRADDRTLVAGVLANRLGRGLALQCDPTVQYSFLLEGHPVKEVSGADLGINSEYNTYRNPGLPPGPIANAGEASLGAALEPAQTDFLYYVANTQGGSFFSKTLAEHNRNVQRYRALKQSGSEGNEDRQKHKRKHAGGL